MSVIHRVLSVVAYCVLVVCCFPCLCWIGYQKGKYGEKVMNPSNPPHLPKSRIDIRRTPPKEQPLNCHLLNLPAELRICIYEFAVGGRMISLMLATTRSRTKYNTISRCYELADGLNTQYIRADGIPIALLLSCRQVYLEALPILHQRNTFHFQVREFEAIVLAALGRYCLPDIRSVCLCQAPNAMFPSGNVSGWGYTFPLLQQMGLHFLALEFALDSEQRYMTPWELLDSEWNYNVASIRNLRRFELFFTRGLSHKILPGHPGTRTDIIQRLRDLMIGPGADERYKILHEEREERMKARREELLNQRRLKRENRRLSRILARLVWRVEISDCDLRPGSTQQNIHQTPKGEAILDPRGAKIQSFTILHGREDGTYEVALAAPDGSPEQLWKLTPE
ncbi:hypothetical protein FB451DRAFT_1184092 [Mycena latifolia]|nr:hypothetical protein FB451DRAFT_1184092 [Mycena latifolia]